MSKSRPLSSSAEDYLEAVYVLARSRPAVRTSDIAARLAVRAPSVVVALRALAARGLVRHQRYGCVELTERGRHEGRAVLLRHQTLFRFLTDVLGLPAEAAEADACRMEHALSPAAMSRFLTFVEFAGGGRDGERRCLPAFRYYAETGRRQKCRRDRRAAAGGRVADV